MLVLRFYKQIFQVQAETGFSSPRGHMVSLSADSRCVLMVFPEKVNLNIWRADSAVKRKEFHVMTMLNIALLD